MRLVLDIEEVPPQATSCLGCGGLKHNGCTAECRVFQPEIPFDTRVTPNRLSACRTAERVKVSEWWEVKGNFRVGVFSLRDVNRDSAHSTAKRLRKEGNENVRVIRVTRYRRVVG